MHTQYRLQRRRLSVLEGSAARTGFNVGLIARIVLKVFYACRQTTFASVKTAKPTASKPRTPAGVGNRNIPSPCLAVPRNLLVAQLNQAYAQVFLDMQGYARSALGMTRLRLSSAPQSSASY